MTIAEERYLNLICFMMNIPKGSIVIGDGLLVLGAKKSFSRKHLPYDNSVCESFFCNTKREELYRTNYRPERELREGIIKYIEFYNSERPHSILRNRTPNKAETENANHHGISTDSLPDTNSLN